MVAATAPVAVLMASILLLERPGCMRYAVVPLGFTARYSAELQPQLFDPA